MNYLTADEAKEYVKQYVDSSRSPFLDLLMPYVEEASKKGETSLAFGRKHDNYIPYPTEKDIELLQSLGYKIIGPEFIGPEFIGNDVTYYTFPGSIIWG